MPRILLAVACLWCLFINLADAADSGQPAVPGAIPYREEKPIQESASRALAGSAILLVLAAAAFVVIKRRMPRSPGAGPQGRSIAVVGSARLGASGRLWVIEFEGERLLVAQSGQQVTLLTSHPAGTHGAKGAGEPA